VAAAAGVLTLGALLGWRLTHQPKTVAAAVIRGKIVKAPLFRLSALSGGGSVSLASFRGKAVVLNFWASDCGPCKEEMPRLQAAAVRWSGKPVEIVGVDTLDSRSAARAFVRKHGVRYTIAFDPTADLALRYAVAFTPTTFFLDPRGRIVKRILGPVSPADLDAEIERALKS
jgi:cytochrome c biogenesis protein CcmG/thiol:disulfide interchange protein DsbE